MAGLTLWWVKKAKPWLKKYWQYLLVPLGLLLLLVRRRPTPQVVTSELAGAGDTALKASREYEASIERSRREAEEGLLRERMKRDAALSNLDESAKTIPDLQAHPERATEFLKDVGKRMRED